MLSLENKKGIYAKLNMNNAIKQGQVEFYNYSTNQLEKKTVKGFLDNNTRCGFLKNKEITFICIIKI